MTLIFQVLQQMSVAQRSGFWLSLFNYVFNLSILLHLQLYIFRVIACKRENLLSVWWPVSAISSIFCCVCIWLEGNMKQDFLWFPFNNVFSLCHCFFRATFIESTTDGWTFSHLRRGSLELLQSYHEPPVCFSDERSCYQALLFKVRSHSIVGFHYATSR